MRHSFGKRCSLLIRQNKNKISKDSNVRELSERLNAARMPWLRRGDEKLSEEDKELIDREVKAILPRYKKILETEPLEDAVYNVWRIHSPPEVRKRRYPIMNMYFLILIDKLLKWFSRIIRSASTPEEREMRIDEAILICFIGFEWDDLLFCRIFRRRVAPFFVQRGSRKEMVDAVLKRVNAVANNEAYSRVPYLIIDDMKGFQLSVDEKGTILVGADFDHYMLNE